MYNFLALKSVLHVGISTGVVPMYLSEIAPVALRGLCGVFNQFSIIFGVLVAEVIGLNDVLGKKDTWQFTLGKTKTIPAGTKH